MKLKDGTCFDYEAYLLCDLTGLPFFESPRYIADDVNVVNKVIILGLDTSTLHFNANKATCTLLTCDVERKL